MACNPGMWLSCANTQHPTWHIFLMLSSTQLFGANAFFDVKEKREMILDKIEELALLLKDKMGNFQGISCFLGASLVMFSESQSARPTVFGVLLGRTGEAMARSNAWHLWYFPQLSLEGQV